MYCIIVRKIYPQLPHFLGFIVNTLDTEKRDQAVVGGVAVAVPVPEVAIVFERNIMGMVIP
jgi:hypothetical protein